MAVFVAMSFLSSLTLLWFVHPGAAKGSLPAARSYHGMVYDVESDRVVLFGGWAGGETNETWSYDYDADAWLQMSPEVGPSHRGSHAMAYDAESDRVVIFGGVTLTGDTAETWAYDLNSDSWTNMTPATSPPARRGASMAYDVASDRVVLFGGHDTECYGDTWVYDFDSNTWTEMAPPNSPSPRAWEVMEYDAQSQRMVLFGGDPCTGATIGDDFDDTWTYEVGTNRWVEMTSADRPTARGWGAAAYDTESDLIVLFGGSTGPAETWTYDLDANAWSEVETTTEPSGRNAHAMAYDLASDRTVLFGGSWPRGIVWDPSITHNNETWAFNHNTQAWSLPAPPSPDGALLIVLVASIAGAGVLSGAVAFLLWRRRNR